MSVFLIIDRLISPRAKELLKDTSFGAKNKSDENDVSVYTKNDKTYIIYSPHDGNFSNFNAEAQLEISYQLQLFTDGSPLNVIAPSFVQYFASQVTKSDPVYDALVGFANVCPVTMNTPSFQFENIQSDSQDKTVPFKTSVTFSSFPAEPDDIELKYIRIRYPNYRLENTPNKLISDADFSQEYKLKEAVQREGCPLIIDLQGMVDFSIPDDNKKIENISTLTHHQECDINNLHFDRLAYIDLMMKFPTSEWWPKKQDKKYNPNKYKNAEIDINRVKNHPKYNKLTLEEIIHIAKHNFTEWINFTNKTLPLIGLSMPNPIKREEDNPLFDCYTHIIATRFFGIKGQLDIPLPATRYIGIPLFTRNEVTTTFGAKGPISNLNNFSKHDINNHIDECLAIILNFNFSNNKKTQALP